MPEIKNQFTGGKMNKDVDERLVPKGEYRDAMNIQVSTSEGSDVGTVQNILGNKLVDTLSYLSANSTCVGAVADEKNDALYWFVTNVPSWYAPTASVVDPAFNSGSFQGAQQSYKDMILQLKNGFITPVFVATRQDVAYTIYQAGTNISWDSTASTITFPGSLSVTDLEVGMVLYGDSDTLQQSYTGMSVGSINVGTNTITINGNITWLDSVVSPPDEHGTKLFFSLLTDSEQATILAFKTDNIITGINIIDDMLFWTDGYSEPKKINIPRSIAGTDVNGLQHTRLINLDQNINYGSNIPTQEEHITVIRKSPLKPPTLSQLTSTRSGITIGVTDSLNFADTNGALFGEGDSILINILDDANTGTTPNFEVGDTLRLLESGAGAMPPEDYTARVLVTDITPDSGFTTYKVIISTLSSENPIGPTTYEVALEEEGGGLFERKFPRFAYRYKYTDNEYSAIGPFSEVAFFPGGFSYHPTKAYNKGMVNNLKELTLQNFIPSDIPKDVIQVDLLYKNETSSNVYVIKSVVNSDAAWGSGGSYKILTENIHALLPSNQLLRPWDNVPRSALAQEITGNRIVYGNYVQSYDYSYSKALYSPEIEASISSRLNRLGGYTAAKSIKSLRTYDFGVVYGDRYNRETPVLTVSSATQVVPKSFSSNSSSINISLDENPPLWAEYCKVFVKETSNEYYNLVVDRVYDAEDGNVWLSFPSVDRNKVDEDTYIVLKKGIDNSEAVLEEARYKVVAIENEAPDYIKTSYTLISEPNQNIHGFNVFGGNGNNLAGPILSPVEAPSVGHTSFTVNKNLWTNPYSTSTPYGMGLVNLSEFISELEGDDLYVAFSTRVVDDPSGPTHTKRVSGKYLITGISDDGLTGNTDTSNTGGSELFEVHLAKPIPQSDDWLTTNIGELYANGGQLKPHFYRQRVISKPEFDGRFFVKVEEDETIKNKVKPAVETSSDWKVIASNNLYHLIDNDASPGNGNTGGSGGGGYGASTTVAHWEDNLKFGGSNLKAGWFIDNIFYAGMQPGSNNSIANSIYQGSDPSVSDPSFAGSRQWSGDGALSGTSNGEVHSDGLYTHPITGDLYFHLSYSMLESTPNQTSLNDNWTVGNDNPSNPNTFTEDQTVFVSNLKAGKYFRIKGDNSIYIITDAYTERLYNHDGRFITYLGAYLNFMEMTADTNKRLRWTIRYELYGAGQTLASNPKFTAIDNNTAGVLEFVEPFVAEKPNVISSNPAIFETEPKEDTDLDIYYEAANSIPLQLTPDNQEQFIPIGATIDWRDTALPKNLSVISWGGCDPLTYDAVTGYCDPMDEIVNLSTPIDYATYSLLAQLGEIRFIRNDGSFTSATILSATGISASAPWTYTGLRIQITKNIGLAWFNCWSFNNGVESNRVGDTFNKPFITNGVKVSTPLLDQYKQETRKYGLIYSGIYNSNSGVNNLNQFIAAEKITKDINPIHGSIQKLKAGWGQGGDLVALCEDRVLKILANKDALFNADGNTNVTSTNNVLGTAIPYSGEYGISRNPESFASEAYRIYFTDKVRGTVMRLSMDGLTPISNHGMKDWFRDNLKLNSTILGSYDDKKDEYNVTLQQTSDAKRNNNAVTISFREDVKGWVSFKSFTPENAISCANEYYTFKNANIWKHHDESEPRNTFYNEGQSNSTLNVILNDMPGSVKSFNTINYEGSQAQVEANLQDNQYYNLEQKPGWFVDSIFTNKESGSLNEFIEKEGKWFNYIKGKEVQHVIDNESNLTRISIESDGSSSFDQASFAIQGLGILGTAPPPPPPCNTPGCMDILADNYNSNACVSDGSCTYTNYGCTAPTASNYDSGANSDDGSCFWYGCLCDGSVYLNGCTNTSLFTDYYNWVNGGGVGLRVDDGSCVAVLDGCTDPTAFNYNSNATVDDGSCVAVYEGCLEPTANENYNSLVNTDNGTCIWRGCTDITANNYRWEGATVDGLTTSQLWHQAALISGGDATDYNPSDSTYGMQNSDPNPCTYDTGCTDSLALNFDGSATIDDGSCVYCDWYPSNSQSDGSHIYTAAITNESAPSYNDGQINLTFTSPPYTIVTIELLRLISGSVYWVATNAIVSGATTSAFQNVEPGDYYIRVTSETFTTGYGSTSCLWDGFVEGGQMHTVGSAPPFGCTDSAACNYCAGCTFSPSMCDFLTCAGCTDPYASNYDSSATLDNGTCTYLLTGCTDSTANNYDPTATVDDGSCEYDVYGCMDNRQNNMLNDFAATNYAGPGNTLGAGGTEQTPVATINETSASNSNNPCTYNKTVSHKGLNLLNSNNFYSSSSIQDTWWKSGIVSSKHTAEAVFDVSDAPLIQWPGHSADGYSPTSNDPNGTRFSYTSPEAWMSSNGNINSFYSYGHGNSNFEWHYSDDDGTSWIAGDQWTAGTAVQLVRFRYNPSGNAHSGLVNFNHAYVGYPQLTIGDKDPGYEGAWNQKAIFEFLPWTLQSNYYTISSTSYTSTSQYIRTGCKFASYCNTRGQNDYPMNANWPSSASHTCVVGGCTDSTACNYDSSATCDNGTCISGTATVYYAYLANGNQATTCYIGPSCDPGNLGIAYPGSSGFTNCCDANPGLCS